MMPAGRIKPNLRHCDTCGAPLAGRQARFCSDPDCRRAGHRLDARRCAAARPAVPLARTPKYDERFCRRFRQFWEEGHSTAEIGRRLGVTKNAIVGLRRSLNLPSRDSPIRRAAGDGPPRSRRERAAVTLPPLPTVASPLPVAVAVSTPQPARPPGQSANTAPRRPVAVETCQYPVTERRPWRFCEDPAEVGSPYCKKHRADCQVKVRDLRVLELA